MKRKRLVVGIGFVAGAVAGGIAAGGLLENSSSPEASDGEFFVSISRLTEMIEVAINLETDRAKIEDALADKMMKESFRQKADGSIDLDTRDPSRGIEPPTELEPD